MLYFVDVKYYAICYFGSWQSVVLVLFKVVSSFVLSTVSVDFSTVYLCPRLDFFKVNLFIVRYIGGYFYALLLPKLCWL